MCWVKTTAKNNPATTNNTQLYLKINYLNGPVPGMTGKNRKHCRVLSQCRGSEHFKIGLVKRGCHTIEFEKESDVENKFKITMVSVSLSS